MPTTIETLAVIVIGVLPGAMYVWARERQTGMWGAQLTDRALRFLGWSAVLHLLLAPATYWLWETYVRTGLFQAGEVSPFTLWLPLLPYLIFPVLIGTVAGNLSASGPDLPGRIARTRIQSRNPFAWAAIFSEHGKPPRAWDHLFASGGTRAGWVRIRLKSGGWVGGWFGGHPDREEVSYAAGYPEPQDLFIAQRYELTPQGGFAYRDGEPVARDEGLLLDWNNIEYLMFTYVLEGSNGRQSQ